jgi:hypothetical protein
MYIKIKRSAANANGFILPITLGLISLVGLWGTILIEQMHIQSAQIEKSWQEKFIFYKAQNHLNQCLQQTNLELSSSKIVDQCCLIEDLSYTKNKKSSRTSQQKLYRVSVHHQLIHPLNKNILGSSRLQASIIQSPQAQRAINLSWREIFDLSWEKELSSQTVGNVFIWDQLPICQHLLQIH